MTIYFGFDLLRAGENLRFWGTVSAELIVLSALSFFMKKKERLRKEREDDLTNNGEE